MLTIYQKPTCSTCRDVMTRLKEAGVEYDAINYIIDPPSREKLVELIAKMGITPRELLRTKEPEYRELGLDDQSLSDDRIIDAMIEHPSLIQRPIIEYGSHAALTRPAAKADEIIEQVRMSNE
jgi:arsenate reductase (glutaredoxin)